VYDAEEEMQAAAEEETKPAVTKKLEDMTSEEIEQLLFPKVQHAHTYTSRTRTSRRERC
jgi:hypothetical protein